MVLKGVFAFVVGLLLASGAAMADSYRPDEFLGLDLSKAALSPKLLGPPAQFEPVPVQAKAVDAKPKVTAKIAVSHVAAQKRHDPARAKLVRHHTNPLDAQAFDTRIQVWPCKSGGICNWER